MQMQKRFLLEASPTKILQRIIKQIALELNGRDQQCLILALDGASDSKHYLKKIEIACPDFVIITNPYSRLSQTDPDTGQRLFEQISANLIFIHHESLCVSSSSIEDSNALLRSYQHVAPKSHHFCIEYHNYSDLRELGIDNSYPVLHCTEFSVANIPARGFNKSFQLSFVGHAVHSSPRFALRDHPHRLALIDYCTRLNDLGHKIAPSAKIFATGYTGDYDDRELSPLTIGAKCFYLLIASKLSLELRGEIINGIGEREIDIFGGDPSYLQGKPEKLRNNKPSVRYHCATKTAAETAAIYAQSNISLNITSLQFDQAVINRVLDIGACGGFPLTDWKDDLAKITTVAQEISYRSIEELNHKIDYFSHPDHGAERDDIAKAFQDDVLGKCTYGHLVDGILKALKCTPAKQGEDLKIDLGCDREAVQGYVSIDTFLNEGIGANADINQRLPFPTSSIDQLSAHNSLQFAQNPIAIMNELWRVSKHDARVDMVIAASDGTNALQESNANSFWSLSSIKHYCVQYPAFLRFSRDCGFRGFFRLERVENVIRPNGEARWHVLLQAVKPRREQLLRHSLRAINLAILLESDKSLGGHTDWPTQLKQLLIAAAQNRRGSSFCFILDHTSIAREHVWAEVGAAMMETMLRVPNPASGDYPGVCMLPCDDGQDTELLVSISSDRISLGDALAQLELSIN